jgi:hypothetical protein
MTAEGTVGAPTCFNHSAQNDRILLCFAVLGKSRVAIRATTLFTQVTFISRTFSVIPLGLFVYHNPLTSLCSQASICGSLLGGK